MNKLPKISSVLLLLGVYKSSILNSLKTTREGQYENAQVFAE